MSGQQHHNVSSGRGGAGNMVDSTKSPKLQPKDLETPTLKTPVVTTGRGGSGNMAKNTDPIETRARQDVEPVTRRPSHGASHIGRGGAANIVKQSEDVDRQQNGSAIADEQDEGLAAKGRNWLLGKKHHQGDKKDGAA